ncbi:MAG: hypothetical protein JSS89_08780 [Bacteroidetes bacterium]|nr:hypothetical protein [Bacteroidota bacterium]
MLLIGMQGGKAQGPIHLGVNVDEMGAFTNMVDHTNRYSKATGYDANGWPMSDFDLVLFDGRPATEWNGTIDDPDGYRIDYSGAYQSSFRGQGTVRASGTAVSISDVRYDAASNTTFFTLNVGGYPNANHGLVFLSFTNTQRLPSSPPSSGITELRVMRPGYDLATTQIFTDAFLRLCTTANFECYRFYNVQNIWDGEPTYPTRTTWTQRKLPSSASQRSMASMTGQRDGWCWEYIIALANTLKKDIWINVHMSCDSQYVTSLASLLKTQLDPAINIYVENSNEVWSPTQATHGPYNQAEATARGITFDQNYARRCVELSQWFSTVLGASAINERVRVILAGQQAYPGRSDNHLNFIKNTFGDPKNFVYATSTALYFGSTKASNTDPTVINDGMIEAIDAQITAPTSALYRKTHITKAAAWGLVGGCTSYEGGVSLPEGGNTNNLAAQIRANRTPAMANVITHSYRPGWSELGGGLALYFTLASAYNRYGCWGLTDDPANPDRNAKMSAVRALLAPTTDVGDNSVSLERDVVSCTAYTILGELVASSTSMRDVVQQIQPGLYMIVVRSSNGHITALMRSVEH